MESRMEKMEITRKLGRNAREQLLEKYTSDKHVERILRKLEELLDR